MLQDNIVVKITVFCYTGLTFTLSFTYTNFDTLKKKALSKHCGKRWNCSKRAISPFLTMFSMQSVS